MGCSVVSVRGGPGCSVVRGGGVGGMQCGEGWRCGWVAWRIQAYFIRGK